MANTPNLDLVKPAGTDHALVSVINANSDKIDGGFGTLSEQIAYEKLTTATDFNTLRGNTSLKQYRGEDISIHTNRPSSLTSSYPFALECIPIGDNYTRQILHVYGSGVVTWERQRYYSSGSPVWNEWRQVTPSIVNVNNGSSQSPVTNLDDIANNTSGNIVFAAAISPVSGSVVSGSYWKTSYDNTQDSYSIIFVRQYSNDMFFYSKAAGTVKGWEQIVTKSDTSFARTVTAGLNSGGTIYLNHTASVMLMTDRGGLWTEGSLGRTLKEIDSNANITVTRESNTKLKIVSSYTYSTQVTAFGIGEVSFSST